MTCKWQQRIKVPVRERQDIPGGGHKTVEVGSEDYSIEIEIDVIAIGRLLGQKACRSKGGVSRAMNGLVKVRRSSN